MVSQKIVMDLFRDQKGNKKTIVQPSLPEADEGSCPSVRLLLDLALKLNSSFFQGREMEEIYLAALVGATAGEGLGFNRAFLLMLDKKQGVLKGQMAVGPDSLQDAHRIWNEISSHGFSLLEIIERIRECSSTESGREIVRFVRTLEFPVREHTNPVVRALIEKRAILLDCDADPQDSETVALLERLGVGQAAVAPLFIHNMDFGVIVADNPFSRHTITDDHVAALYLLASLVAMAIYQRQLGVTLYERIQRLERLNLELEQSKRILVDLESLAVLGRVVDRVFHEIKNPLAVIGGLSALLRRRAERDEGIVIDQDGIFALDTIIKEAEKIQNVLSEIAEIENISHSDLNTGDLTVLVREAVSLMRPDLDHVGIVTHLNIPETEVLARFDKAMLKQALLCIIKNAVEAMPDGGTMIVSMERIKKGPDKNERVEIRITDTGLGIAKGHFSRVQSPFFSTKLSGLGLGLSKAKQIIEEHQGTLSLSTNRIGGTTCVISLPVDPEPVDPEYDD